MHNNRVSHALRGGVRNSTRQTAVPAPALGLPSPAAFNRRPASQPASSSYRARRTWLWIPLLLAWGLTLNACASTFAWKEEVILHDGKTLIVKRTHTYDPKGPREIGQPPPLVEATLTFTVPGTEKEVSWKSDFGRGYQDNLGLLFLDFQKDVPYIATTPTRCHAYNKWGRPNPPYVFFKYTGEWTRIPLEEFPSVFREANVLLAPLSNESVKKQVQDAMNRFNVVPAAQIESLNRDSEREHRVLAREPITHGPGNTAASCGEMIYDGRGGWIGMGWFRKQPSYEACLRVCAINNVSAEYCPCSDLFKNKEK